MGVCSDGTFDIEAVAVNGSGCFQNGVCGGSCKEVDLYFCDPGCGSPCFGKPVERFGDVAGVVHVSVYVDHGFRDPHSGGIRYRQTREFFEICEISFSGAVVRQFCREGFENFPGMHPDLIEQNPAAGGTGNDFLVFIFQIPLGNLPPPHHRPEWLNLAIKWPFSKVPL